MYVKWLTTILTIAMVISCNIPKVEASYGTITLLKPEELIHQDDLIAVGKIIGFQGVVATINDNQWVCTDNQLLVDYYLGKGPGPRSLSIRVRGGEAYLPDGTLIGSTFLGKLGEIGDRICVFVREQNGNYMYIEPNGMFFMRKNEAAMKKTAYAPVLKLKKHDPQGVSGSLAVLLLGLNLGLLIIVIKCLVGFS